MKKRGFTLAEVLITLAIIGIVAGMTIPSIVMGNQKTELEARFAKSYRTLMYAVNMSVAQNGPFETWEWKTTYSNNDRDNFVKTYFLPYLNTVKFCPADNSVKGCFPDTTYKYVKGTDWKNLSTWTHPKVLLADESTLMFTNVANYLESNTKSLDIYVDTNGRKKPNKLGFDVHIFSMYPQTGDFLPYGVYRNSTYDEKTNSFERNSADNIRSRCMLDGYYCSALIVTDGYKINY